MLKVLLVDDEKNVCLGMKALIDWSRFGFEIAGMASNGQQALELHQRNHFDLIITDLRMPNINGLELIRILYEQNDPCTVIIVSAYGEFEYAQSAMRYGVNYYLLKPVDETVLSEYLVKIAEKQRQQNHTQTQPILDEPQCAALSTDRILAYIRSHFREPLTLNGIAKEFGFNPAYLGRIIKRDTGMKFNHYLNRCRMDTAKKLLRESEKAIYEVAELVGYKDLNYFYRCFKEETGHTPSDYKRKADQGSV